MRVVLPLLALAATAALATSCSGPSGTRISPDELERIEKTNAAGGPPPAGATTVAESAAKPAVSHSGELLSPERARQRNDLDDRRVKLTRRREDQVRNQAELDVKRNRTSLEQSNADASEAMSVQQTDRDRRVATEDVEHFLKVEKERRLAEDALDLARSQDGLLE